MSLLASIGLWESRISNVLSERCTSHVASAMLLTYSIPLTRHVTAYPLRYFLLERMSGDYGGPSILALANEMLENT
jgi:hypothetical protein